MPMNIAMIAAADPDAPMRLADRPPKGKKVPTDEVQRIWSEVPHDSEIEGFQTELDDLYRELIGIHGLEPDAALLRVAHMNAWAAAVRSRFSRSNPDGPAPL
jgi:hypothetical protein